MIYISHRGNINGRILERENQPDYIIEALKLGYNVEIDFWLVSNHMMLGHDKPQYNISKSFLIQEGLWIHAKNFDGFEYLINNSDTRCFWHTDEDVVLTSKKDVWIFPGKLIIKNSIVVLPETVNYSISELKISKGICSDYIGRYKNEFDKLQ